MTPDAPKEQFQMILAELVRQQVPDGGWLRWCAGDIVIEYSSGALYRYQEADEGCLLVGLSHWCAAGVLQCVNILVCVIEKGVPEAFVACRHRCFEILGQWVAGVQYVKQTVKCSEKFYSGFTTLELRQV